MILKIIPFTSPHFHPESFKTEHRKVFISKVLAINQFIAIVIIEITRGGNYLEFGFLWERNRFPLAFLGGFHRR